MTRDDIDLVIDAMRRHGVTRLEYAHARKGRQLCLTLPEGTVAQPQPAAQSPLLPVTSPGIGQFTPRGLDDGLPPLLPGANVRAAEVLGYIAQGSALLILSAPQDSTLSGDLPAQGALFGYGDTVLQLEVQPR